MDPRLKLMDLSLKQVTLEWLQLESHCIKKGEGLVQLVNVFDLHSQFRAIKLC